MKHLKIIKEDTVETFVTSNSAGIPCVCCYDQTHENYDSNEPVVMVTERPAPTSKPILQFTIYGYQASYPGIILAPVVPDCQTLTFDYEEGMTWIDWCNSSYNTLNWTINDGRVLHHLDYAVYDGFNGTSIKGTDTIDGDKCYSYSI